MLRITLLALAAILAAPALAQHPSPGTIDDIVRGAMARTGARGLALAIIEDGEVALVRSWGRRSSPTR